ncbi:hypothetical protein [Paraburkholderia heleia]|uniref:hypothetical protein n=1 Tax=Paraburkholderia heleia TaxID=634127 RepID=UPI0031D27376
MQLSNAQQALSLSQNPTRIPNPAHFNLSFEADPTCSRQDLHININCFSTAWLSSLELTLQSRTQLHTKVVESIERQPLTNLADNDQPLPWRGDLPNKIAIARACGVDRDVFYTNPEAIGPFCAFVRKERDRRIAAGDFSDHPEARLRSYLVETFDVALGIPYYGRATLQ